MLMRLYIYWLVLTGQRIRENRYSVSVCDENKKFLIEEKLAGYWINFNFS